MKDQFNQIVFLDTILLPLFGFESIIDYKFHISLQMVYKNHNLIFNLNKLVPTIKNIFPATEFNLHKTNDQIVSFTKAIAVLKKCLFISSVPFEMIKISNINYIHLLKNNIGLQHYIQQTYGSLVKNIVPTIKQCTTTIILSKDLDLNIKRSYFKNVDYLGSTCFKKFQQKYSIELPLESIKSINVLNKELFGAYFTIENDRQILITGNISDNLFDTILPFETCIYSKLYLNIYSSEILNVINLCINTIIFKKAFVKILNQSSINIDIDKNIIIFEGGTCSTVYITSTH